MGAFGRGFVTGLATETVNTVNKAEDEERAQRAATWNIWAQTVPKQIAARRAKNSGIIDTANTIIASNPELSSNPNTALFMAAGVESGRWENSGEAIAGLKEVGNVPPAVLQEQVRKIKEAGILISKDSTGQMSFSQAPDRAFNPGSAPAARTGFFDKLAGKRSGNLAQEFQSQTGYDVSYGADGGSVLSGLNLNTSGSTFLSREDVENNARMKSAYTQQAMAAAAEISDDAERATAFDLISKGDVKDMARIMAERMTPREQEIRKMEDSARVLAFKHLVTMEGVPRADIDEALASVTDYDGNIDSMISAMAKVSNMSAEKKQSIRDQATLEAAAYGSLGNSRALANMLKIPEFRKIFGEERATLLSNLSAADIRFQDEIRASSTVDDNAVMRVRLGHEPLPGAGNDYVTPPPTIPDTPVPPGTPTPTTEEQAAVGSVPTTEGAVGDAATSLIEAEMQAPMTSLSTKRMPEADTLGITKAITDLDDATIGLSDPLSVLATLKDMANSGKLTADKHKVAVQAIRMAPQVMQHAKDTFDAAGYNEFLTFLGDGAEVFDTLEDAAEVLDVYQVYTLKDGTVSTIRPRDKKSWTFNGVRLGTATEPVASTDLPEDASDFQRMQHSIRGDTSVRSRVADFFKEDTERTRRRLGVEQ